MQTKKILCILKKFSVAAKTSSKIVILVAVKTLSTVEILALGLPAIS